jgi:hypothetical protein
MTLASALPPAAAAAHAKLIKVSVPMFDTM